MSFSTNDDEDLRTLDFGMSNLRLPHAGLRFDMVRAFKTVQCGHHWENTKKFCADNPCHRICPSKPRHKSVKMATTAGQQPLPSAGKSQTRLGSACSHANLQIPEARQSNFEQAVAYALHLWPALTLAVQNQWGGPDSADKRDWFAGAIAELFPEISDAPPSRTTKVTEEPDLEEIETVLLQIMVDEFDVNVDDDSGLEVANQILTSRVGCMNGDFGEVEKLRSRWATKKGGKVEQMFKKADDADQDTDWESDDDDEDDEDSPDVQMDDAPALVSVPKEKPQPEVDEDGFTTVTRKKR